MSEELFLQFHQLASARKMDLAMRGLPCNCMVDELFDEAQQLGLTASEWPGFVQKRLPSPRDEAASPEGHPLTHIAHLLKEAMHGSDDVDVHRLVALVKEFLVVLESLGAFAAITIQEARSNLAKIEDGMQHAAGGGASLLGLLRSEKAAGMHGAGGLLADPSAAMGVLWIGRLLAFWVEVCVLRAQPPPPSGEPVSLRATLESAYEHLLLPYHGWVTQKAFEVAVAATPDWEAVRSTLAPSEGEFRDDVKGFVLASQEALRRVNQALAQNDLVDVRKCV